MKQRRGRGRVEQLNRKVCEQCILKRFHYKEAVVFSAYKLDNKTCYISAFTDDDCYAHNLSYDICEYKL